VVDDKGSPDKCVGIFDKGQGVEQALGAEPFDVVQGHESFDKLKTMSLPNGLSNGA
jgi:hypothetical protein